MDKMQKASAKEKLRIVRAKLVEANMWVEEGDALKAFMAAEVAYMEAWEAKNYLDKVFQSEHPLPLPKSERRLAMENVDGTHSLPAREI